MKKSRILGYALTLAATLMVGSAMGQVDNTFASGKFIDFATEATDYVTVNTTTAYYATPDAAYHPGWNAGTKTWTITAGTTWVWTVPTPPGAAPTINIAPAATPKNYVEVTWNAVGDHDLTVYEKLPDSFGGSCLTSTPVVHTVRVIDAPTVAFTTNYASGQTAFVHCSGDAALTTPSLGVAFTESSPGTDDRYVLGYTIKKDEYSAAGTWTDNAAGAVTKEVISAKTGNITLPTLTLTAGSTRTRYIVTLTYLSSTITRKGKVDILANLSYNGPTATDDDLKAIDWKDFLTTETENRVFIVNAKPVTGPIYHIGNNKAK
ncbi:hypothetical protein [Acetobacteroides hydrogenigenes]|uniref:Uncharacterized protein n=1 Tax=Acetobacteroides hydrogenigenes TaxID=979970 RepID=A0A4R2F1T0_9BACT|nr:hypothetical protein [Acetobacteroides hydrogenigenes]TCN73315.1 hypothetical protein CLV25_101540 [Acetobacteroides hydrogenigenes]